MKQEINEVMIYKNELQLLLNLFGDESIVLDYPLFDLKFFRAKAVKDGYRLRLLADNENFLDLACDMGEFADEMPTFDDIKYCMLLSGLIDYDNIDDFRDKLAVFSKLDRTIYFAPDTNLFYQGFVSRSGITDPHFVVVDTVYEEMEYAINYKYKPGYLYHMQQTAHYHDELLEELANKKLKKARKAAYIAMKQYQSVRDRVMEVKAAEPSTNNSEKNDLIIVKSLREFDSQNSYGLVVLLTSDTNMADLCTGKGPECFHFTYPSSMDVEKCTNEELIDLIFSLSTVCGFIKCNSVVVYGEYGYKKHDDNSMKLVFQDEKLFESFKKELELCRKLAGLKIEA